MSESVLHRLSDTTLVALCVDGDAWPRSLMSATLIPDKWMGLVERRDGRRWFVPAGEDPKPQRGDKLLLVRNRPITVPLQIAETRAADKHEVSVACEILVRWHAREDELAALRRALPESGELTLDGLAQWVATSDGEAALRQFVRQHPAAKLVHEDVRDALLDLLREALKRLLFTAGMTLERVATCRCSSTSLAREETLRRETAARVERIKSREMVEEAALAATRRRLDDLGGLLDKLKTAAAGDEQMQWHELLPSLSPAERGRLLENLWRVTPDQHTVAAVVVVAGRECVWLDPADPQCVVRRQTLGEDLGGLRSVTFSPERGWLLVGAALGVWALDAGDGEVCGRFEALGAEQSRTGFNAAAIAGDKLFATHSQLGAWCWPLDAPEQAEARLTPIGGVPRAIRAATATGDGRVLVSADDRVHILTADGDGDEILPAAPGMIQCLAVEGQTIYAGTTNGELAALDVDRPDGWTVVHRATAAFESIHPRRWSDLLELVIPAGSAGVRGVYSREGVVARLMDTRVAVRRAWACDDLLVALNDYRDRLIVMRPDAPEQTGSEIPVGRMLGHSVQDVCLVVRHEGSTA